MGMDDMSNLTVINPFRQHTPVRTKYPSQLKCPPQHLSILVILALLIL